MLRAGSYRVKAHSSLAWTMNDYSLIWCADEFSRKQHMQFAPAAPDRLTAGYSSDKKDKYDMSLSEDMDLPDIDGMVRGHQESR